MQTSKFLSAMGALAAVILPLQVQAGPDNAEQAKMREVLRRMMQESTATQTGAVTTVSPPVTPAPVKPVVVTAPPPVPRPVVAPLAPVAPPPVIVTPKPETVAVPVAQPASQVFEPVPPPDNEASLAVAREALRKKMLELQATPMAAPTTPVAPAPTVAVAPVAPGAGARPPRATAPVFAATYAPIQAPDSPLSGAKQAKLAELLVRYRADAITAQEYHAQRAAILAEP